MPGTCRLDTPFSLALQLYVTMELHGDVRSIPCRYAAGPRRAVARKRAMRVLPCHGHRNARVHRLRRRGERCRQRRAMKGWGERHAMGTKHTIRINRSANAWLIRRFIDPAATFRFVPAEEVLSPFRRARARAARRRESPRSRSSPLAAVAEPPPPIAALGPRRAAVAILGDHRYGRACAVAGNVASRFCAILVFGRYGRDSSGWRCPRRGCGRRQAGMCFQPLPRGAAAPSLRCAHALHDDLPSQRRRLEPVRGDPIVAASKPARDLG
jgi:chromate resistance exported protein